MTKKLLRRFLERFNLGIYHPFPRSAVRFIKENNKGAKLIGAEIGTYRGDNAASIMKTLPMKRFFIIDPYEAYEEYADEKNIQRELNEALRVARRRMSRYKDKVVFIRKKSLYAHNDIPDNLDFVYIDGNHDYESVKKDMEIYFEKLKSGGVLAGHDIQNGFIEEHDGVTKAFVEFVNEKGLFPYILVPDWWVIKK